MRREVYILHNMRVIRLYTSGEDFIELTDNSGLIYRIGSHKTAEFQAMLKLLIKSEK